MKASELRIDNLVYVDGDIVEVESINKTGINIFVDDDTIIEFADFGEEDRHIKPIPLTEEWLLKFGEEDEEGNIIKICDRINKVDIFYNRELKGLFVAIWGSNISGCYSDQEDDYISLNHNIEHVHQLQNLYFALTGEELTIKDLYNIE